MQRFSASEAAFEGFRLIRRQPGAVLAWTVILLVLSLGSLFLSRAMLGGDFSTVLSTNQANPADPSAALAMFSRLAPFGLLAFIIAMVVQTIVAAAVFRAILRPEDKAPGFLSFGADELRLMGLSLIYILLGMGVYIVLVLALVLVIGIGAAVTFASAHNATSGLIAGLLTLVGVIAVLGVMIWLMVRMSLAGAMTFAQRRIRVFGSWSLTRGIFWPLFGCYLLAFIFLIVISLVGTVLALSANAVLSGGDWSVFARTFTKGGYGALTSALTLGLIVQTVIGAAFSTIRLVIFEAPMASAYRDLTAQDAAPSVF